MRVTRRQPRTNNQSRAHHIETHIFVMCWAYMYNQPNIICSAQKYKQMFSVASLPRVPCIYNRHNYYRIWLCIHKLFTHWEGCYARSMHRAHPVLSRVILYVYNTHDVNEMRVFGPYWCIPWFSECTHVARTRCWWWKHSMQIASARLVVAGWLESVGEGANYMNRAIMVLAALCVIWADYSKL